MDPTHVDPFVVEAPEYDITAEFEPGPSSPKVAKLEALDDRYRPAGT